MTEGYPDTQTSLPVEPMDERVQRSRILLAQLCVTKPNTVGEPQALAQTLLGVSRAMANIIYASSPENRIVKQSEQAAPLSRSELWLGAFAGYLPHTSDIIVRFIAERTQTYGTVLSTYTQHTVGPNNGRWELTKEVIVPSSNDILDRVYGRPRREHDLAYVYARDATGRRERTLFPFHSPEYRKGATVSYLRLLQDSCSKLLRATDPKRKGISL